MIVVQLTDPHIVPEAPLRFALEPPGYQSHLSQGGAPVTHTAMIAG